MQLPSNKIGALFLTVVLLVVLVIAGDVVRDKFSVEEEVKLVDADIYLGRQTTSSSSVDPDEDGLLNWQESLYGSDPENADSDGDGTNDGDEIKEGRDPVIAGPDDQLINTKTIIETEFNVPGYTPGSLTDNVSKELFTQYLNLKSVNSLGAESNNTIASQIVSGVSQNTKVEIVYSKSDLTIVTSDDDSLNKYGRELAIIWMDYLNQIELASNLTEGEYITFLSEKYNQASKAFVNIEVPSVAQNIHIELVNNYYAYSVLLGELNLYEQDPIRSLVAIKNAQLVYDDGLNLFTALANYFDDNGIIFEDNQISRFWNLFN